MAYLESLQVLGLRNVSSARLQRLARFNVFTGANGAGKTTLLEAIHLLGLARSFRSAQLKSLVQHGSDALTIHGVVRGSGHARMLHRVGVGKTLAGESRIQVDGAACRSAVRLAELLPLQVLDSAAFELILGPPPGRRQYLDWGVFHVEHGYIEVWRRLQRLLKQRNNLLRHGKITGGEIDSWDAELARLGETLTEMRQRYVEKLLPQVRAVAGALGIEQDGLAIEFYRGWDSAVDFQGVLRRSRARDAELGYTHSGPHRADLRMRWNSQAIGQILSRGQVKLLATALRLAQARVLLELTGTHCIFLVDDLPAELDGARRALVCGQLQQLGGQVFFTSVEARALQLDGLDPSEKNVFHVEHGVVSRE